MTPTIRRVEFKDDVRAIQSAMEGQDQLLVTPTHILHKGGDVVGYWSIGAVPLVLAWHHNDLTASDSYHLVNTLQTVCNDRGHSNHLLGLSKHSPYVEYISRVGYQAFGRTNLYLGGNDGIS